MERARRVVNPVFSGCEVVQTSNPRQAAPCLPTNVWMDLSVIWVAVVVVMSGVIVRYRQPGTIAPGLSLITTSLSSVLGVTSFLCSNFRHSP